MKVVKITSIKKIENYKSKRYDITVADNHNFFANSLLVHNCQNLVHYFEDESMKELEFEETLKLDGCFLLKTYIETYNGGTVTIGDIVNKGLNPTLIGVNKKGEVVPCEITNRFKNGVKDNWVDIYYEPFLKAQIVGKSGKIRSTTNHTYFTEGMVEVKAEDLKVGDTLFMTQKGYDESTLHYFKSSLLGDGSIGGKGHFSYNECHATKYKGYIDYIKNIFSEVKHSTRKQISGYGSEVEHIKVFATKQIEMLREEWYPNGKKKVPKDLSWIDDFTIAKWYMDDGSLAHNNKQNDRALFATNAFEEIDVNRLANVLREMYDVSVSVYYSKGWNIRINYNEGIIDNFWRAIAPHIIKEQRYKLPLKYRDCEYKEYPKAKYKRYLIPVKVLDIKKVDVNKKNFPSGRIGYDIETTTNNYFCNGILVHNSSHSSFKIKENLPLWKDLVNKLSLTVTNKELFKTYRFGFCSRNLELKEALKGDKQSNFEKVVYKYNIKEELPIGYAIQGELIAPDIQSNHEKVKEPELYIFNVFNIEKQEYLKPQDAREFVNKHFTKLKYVPVVNEKVKIFKECKTLEDMLERVEGQSMNKDTISEGRVYKCTSDSNIHFKCISNTYLLKKK